MIRSMTGFGRSEYEDSNSKFTVELKSVNHRYLDINIKMPRKLNFLESAIRTLIREYLERGKVDVFITYEDFTLNRLSLNYNAALASEYMMYFNQMAEQFGLPNDATVTSLARCPEVFTMAEETPDQEELWKSLEQALRGACRSFTESREKEGEQLKADLTQKLEGMDLCVNEIEERSPQIITEYRTRLTEKVAELLGDYPIDEARLMQEVTIYADKICVDEETVRLHSHIKTMKETLLNGGAVGRKLDFIAQEMNREANTILSKANDIATSDTGIRLKTDIEKIREQVQNIE